MKLSEFIQVCRNIVIFWPYSEVGRVNCFSTFKSRAEVNESTFGRIYQDYLEGNFWSRPWVLAGANRNDMEKSYGAILLEHKRGTIADFKTGKISQTIFLNSLQKVEQDGEILTEDELARQNESILLGFLSELSDVYKYTVTPASGPNYEAWLSTNQAAYLVSTPEINSAVQSGINIQSFIPNMQVQIIQNHFGVEDIRSSMVEIEVTTCDPPEVAFNYELPDIVEDFIVICS